jgi:RHS repeat-associated protein
MNSSKATAQDRAGIRFQDNQSAALNIARRDPNRSTLWLLARFLPLLILAIILGISPAHATGIGNGEVVTGAITGAGVDTYTFNCNSGDTFFASVELTGTHTYDAELQVWDPSNVNVSNTTAFYNSMIKRVGAASGQWTLKVNIYHGTGSQHITYALTVIRIPGAAAISAGNAGGWLSPSATATPGTMYRGELNVYNFTAVHGSGSNTATITLTRSSGSFETEIRVIRPDGSDWGGNFGINYSVNITSVASGNYTVVVYRHGDGDTTDGYTIAASGAGVGMPGSGKNDGDCPTCDAKVAFAPQCDAVNPTGRVLAGDPINVATGNLFEKVTDYTTVGTNPLALTRSYNSLSYTRNLYPTMMGPNWRTNYDRYLRVPSSTMAAAERADGRVINFALSGGTGTPDTDVDVKLTYSGSTYTLTNSDDSVETYTVTSGKGTLSSIAWPNGYTQTMNYTSGVLTSVSDSYSRSLSFTYTSGVLTGVTTPDSATLTYGYTTVSGQSLLTSVTYNTSPTKTQTYVYSNSVLPFMLTSITDENGNTNSQWAYDGAGRATSSQHAGGADLTSISYDDSTGNRTVTGPLGNAETYHFTTSQGIAKVSQIDRAANSPVASASRYFSYDGNGYLATATDWDGNSTHWTNNSHGQSTSVTEAYGAGVARTTTVSYDSTWVHKPYTITKTNVTIDDRYDGTTGTLTTHTLTDSTGGSTNGHTQVWAYTYNGTGEMLTETFPRTGTTVKNTYTYSSGALASITDQLSHTTTINTANGTGQPTQITDSNSVVTDLVYDHRNRLTSKTVNAGTDEVTTYTYIASGQPDVITLPDSSTIDFDYDNAQRLTKITNTAGETINYTLNAAGKPTTVTFKDSGGTTQKSWTATYDVLGDMLTHVGSGGANETTTYAYDGNQNRTSTTDANSKVWAQAWDALNRASTVTDPLTHTAAPTYNNLDYVTAQTDFNGYSTSYTRDAFSNAIARSSPDSGSWSFTFNEDNKPTAVTDARSTASSLTYDAADRLTALSITGYSGENTTYTYDDTTSGNKGVGRLTSVSDESGSTSRVYDNFGNITSETRVIGGKTYTISYSYDLANRITEIIYPSGRYVDYTYNSSGYLTTVTTKPTSGGSVTTLASSIVHKPFGPIASFTYGNSEAQTRTWSNNYWLTDLDTVYSGTYVQQIDFGYDYAGNLTSITDNIDNTRNETLTVDDLNRLHTASGKYGSRTYTYDNNSNRATEVVGATTYTYTNVASKNRLDHYTDGSSTRNFTYTANGNMATDDRTFIGGGSVSNTFGGRDRLESMTVNGASITYKINAFGQRVSMATVSATTHYIHDIEGNIIAEANGSTGATTGEYVWMEGELLAQIDGSGNIVYVHNSQVSAPQKITNPSRTVVFDQIREPFGEVYSTPTNTTPTNHRFPGQYADANNSLSYNNMRDYDTSIGRYIESDPIGFRGGLNLYGYAAQQPMQAIDPSGEDLNHLKKSAIIAYCILYPALFPCPPPNDTNPPAPPPYSVVRQIENDDKAKQSSKGKDCPGAGPTPGPDPTPPATTDASTSAATTDAAGGAGLSGALLMLAAMALAL